MGDGGTLALFISGADATVALGSGQTDIMDSASGLALSIASLAADVTVLAVPGLSILLPQDGFPEITGDGVGGSILTLSPGHEVQVIGLGPEGLSQSLRF